MPMSLVGSRGLRQEGAAAGTAGAGHPRRLTGRGGLPGVACW